MRRRCTAARDTHDTRLGRDCSTVEEDKTDRRGSAESTEERREKREEKRKKGETRRTICTDTTMTDETRNESKEKTEDKEERGTRRESRRRKKVRRVSPHSFFCRDEESRRVSGSRGCLCSGETISITWKQSEWGQEIGGIFSVPLFGASYMAPLARTLSQSLLESTNQL